MRSGTPRWRRVLRRVCTAILVPLILAAIAASSASLAFGLGTALVLCVAAEIREPSVGGSAEQEALVAAVTGTEVEVDGKRGDARLGKYKPMAKHAEYWALKVRERFGVVQDKAADLMAVRRWVSDEMMKDTTREWKDMRIKDRVALQTLVTRLAVVPSAFELEVEQMVRGALASELRGMFPAPKR